MINRAVGYAGQAKCAHFFLPLIYPPQRRAHARPLLRDSAPMLETEHSRTLAQIPNQFNLRSKNYE